MGSARRILVINPGSTSTKVSIFTENEETARRVVRHGDGELARFESVARQRPYRTRMVMKSLESQDLAAPDLEAVVARGGLLKPISSGTYRINQRMLADLEQASRGEHASNLGAMIAWDIASPAGKDAFIVDPVSVDELAPVARTSGLKGLVRQSLSHALNTKAVAKRYCTEKGMAYRDVRLIVGHLGSGISISAHAGARMIDVSNPREEGPFSMERAGSVPTISLVQHCIERGLALAAVDRMLFREGGVYSYLGTRDLKDVEESFRAGDEEAGLVFRAMIYQIAKEIGAMATVLEGRVDAVVLTGGMANSRKLVEGIISRIGFIAEVVTYPGEDEMRALAMGALRVLRGEEPALEYV